MARTTIRYGLRRFPLYAVLFGGAGVGMVAWGQSIEKETFVFPLGRLEPESARVVVSVIGACALLHLALTCYVRFVRRPLVVLSKSSVSLPLGEFGLSKVVLRAGDVLSLAQDGPRRGGWRTCRVRHRMGEAAVRSSQLPSDDAFFEVCRALEELEVDH